MTANSTGMAASQTIRGTSRDVTTITITTQNVMRRDLHKTPAGYSVDNGAEYLPAQ